MFASVELALRIDTAEARLSRSFARCIGIDGGGRGPAPFAMPVGAGFAVFARSGSPMNKVIGLGIDAPLCEADLEPIEEAFRLRGEDTRVELSTLAHPPVGGLLTSRGYRLSGFENVLGADLRAAGGAPAAAAPGVSVELAPSAELSPWLEVLVDGFSVADDTGVPPESFPREVVLEATRDFARAPDVRRYVARLAGRAVGAASMRLEAGVAFMCGAATLASYRGQGVQQALLARRVVDARAAGCDVAVITTAPGTRSQANSERRGFSLLYSRAVLVRRASA
jgi:GNAT superfamily N-acetyltransferase